MKKISAEWISIQTEGVGHTIGHIMRIEIDEIVIDLYDVEAGALYNELGKIIDNRGHMR